MQHAEASCCNSSRLFSNSEVVKEVLKEEHSERGSEDEGRLLLIQKLLGGKKIGITAVAVGVFFLFSLFLIFFFFFQYISREQLLSYIHMVHDMKLNELLSSVLHDYISASELSEGQVNRKLKS